MVVFLKKMYWPSLIKVWEYSSLSKLTENKKIGNNLLVLITMLFIEYIGRPTPAVLPMLK